MHFHTIIHTIEHPNGAVIERSRSYKVNGIPLPKAVYRWLWNLVKA